MNSEEADEIHYEILQCTIESTRDEIQRQVRKLSLLYHPDKTSDPAAKDVFLKIQKAKEILLDEDKKKVIDEKIKAKLKRKDHESKRVSQMDASRKKKREDFEKKLSQEMSKTSVTPTSTSSVPVVSKSNVSAFRSESRKRMNVLEEELFERQLNASKLASAASAATEADTASTADRTSSEESCQPCKLKVKWRRSEESHSDESIFQLVKCFGEVKSIVMGAKGTSATVTFAEPRSVILAVRSLETAENFRVSAIDEQPKKASVFTHVFQGESDGIVHNFNSDKFRVHLKSQVTESELIREAKVAVEKNAIIGSLDELTGAVPAGQGVFCVEELNRKEDSLLAKMKAAASRKKALQSISDTSECISGST